jgi:5-methylcytosine-specific restriction endonuclease McrA
MRDLRTEGWVLATYREDRYLSPDELRLVQVGGHVWNPAYRSRQSMSITDKERQAVFAADNFCCTRCGIGGGEPFADDALRTAKLTVARVTSLTSDLPMLSTLCDRCHVASRDEPAAPDLVHRLDALDEAARERLRQWVRAGVRPQSAEEVLWGEYRRLPAAARQHFIETLLSL